MFWNDPAKAALNQLGEVLELNPADRAPLLPLLRGALRSGGVVGLSRAGRQTIVSLAGVPTDGVFELASVTKPFTAALVGGLVQQGRLSWEGRLSALGGPFRGLPATFTPYSLATHTAGLPFHPARAALRQFTQFNDPYGGLSPRQVLASARRWAPPVGRQPPRFAYSNLGFGVLALAAAYAAGEDLSGLGYGVGYGAALRRLVTAPLGLESVTLVPPPAGLVTPRGVLGSSETTSFGALVGAGGLYGNAADLLDFARSQLQGASGAFWRAAATPPGLSAPRSAVAPGWFYTPLATSKTAAGDVVWHDGVARGTRTALGFCPATQTAVVVLARGGLPLAGQRALVPVLALRLLGVRFEPRSP
ncbi:serine hydrolase [Deinococcus sp.]|uniref:serine hydrolase domain-containing protein n=1 Tax=Deinococcus sp. TaxID=47478 RepID=UPI0025C5A9AB|nr:serine hydrolase domain-containing protein [Deinococcus sp.]